jgi:hypothetical protein
LKLFLLQSFSKGLVASIYYGLCEETQTKLNNQIVSASNENFRHRKIGMAHAHVGKNSKWGLQKFSDAAHARAENFGMAHAHVEKTASGGCKDSGKLAWAVRKGSHTICSARKLG